MQTKAYAAQSATTPFGPHAIDRRAPGPKDVAIEILVSAASATATCTPRAANGRAPNILACRGTRSSAR